MTWGFVGAAAVSAVGSVVQGQSQKKAAEKQAQAAQSELELQERLFDKQLALGEDYRKFGEQYLPMLGEAMQPINREQELAAFYAGPEYQMMSGQARNQQLAAAEATGGLGSTSTQNTLGSISPQLGMQHLAMREGQQADLFNRLLSGVNIGLSGAGMQQQAMGAYGTQAGNIMSNSAAQQAAATLAQGQNWSNMISNLGGVGLAWGMQNTPTSTVSPPSSGYGQYQNPAYQNPPRN